MDVLRDELNNWLVPIFGDDRASVDYDRDSIEAIREDRSKKVVDLNSQIDRGWLKRNQAREDLKRGSMGPAGDVATVSGAVVPLDAIGMPETGTPLDGGAGQ